MTVRESELITASTGNITGLLKFRILVGDESQSLTLMDVATEIENTGIITGGADSSTTFSALTDTPADYTGFAGQQLVVNALETGVEFTAAGAFLTNINGEVLDDLSNVFALLPNDNDVLTFDTLNNRWEPQPIPTIVFPDQNFLQLTDTPNDYATQAGNTVIVNAGETGLEFVALPGGATPPPDLVIMRHAPAIGNNGDPQVGAIYETQSLNDKQLDASSICVLAANSTFRLEPGTYNIRFDTRVMMEKTDNAVLPAGVLSYSVRLFDVTLGMQILLGSSGSNFGLGTPGGSGGDGSQSSAAPIINGQFVVTDNTTSYSIQHLSNVSTGNFNVQWGGRDIGLAGASENVFATLVLERVAL